jgi:hypothetical protein
MTMAGSMDTHDGADDDGVPDIVAFLRGHDVPTSDASAERIMTALRARPVPRRATGMLASFRGRTPRYAPHLAAAAAVAVIVFGAGVAVGRSYRGNALPVAQAVPSTTTRFVLAAPGVSGVSVVGDFNAWDRTATPMKRDASTGQWTVDLPLTAGRYTYAFVVDGGRWIADPDAPLAPADDYGQRNSVLLVNASYTKDATR